MNSEEFSLSSVSKLFEYEKMSRELDSCTNIDLMRNLCKSYLKLYFKQQEVFADISNFKI
jgi:hypothetical protein